MTRLLSIAALACLLAGPAPAQPSVGFDRFDVRADHRSGPIAAGIWYPVGRETYVVPGRPRVGRTSVRSLSSLRWTLCRRANSSPRARCCGTRRCPKGAGFAKKTLLRYSG